MQLEPAAGSLGVYGVAGTVAEFLEGQKVAPYLDAVARDYPLVRNFRERVAATVDFERVEPARVLAARRARGAGQTTDDPDRLIDAPSTPTASDAAAPAPRKPP